MKKVPVENFQYNKYLRYNLRDSRSVTSNADLGELILRCLQELTWESLCEKKNCRIRLPVSISRWNYAVQIHLNEWLGLAITTASYFSSRSLDRFLHLSVDCAAPRTKSVTMWSQVVSSCKTSPTAAIQRPKMWIDTVATVLQPWQAYLAVIDDLSNEGNKRQPQVPLRVHRCFD